MVGDKEFADKLSQHHERLLAGVEKNLADFRALRKEGKNAYLDGQIKYWEHVVAALSWSTRVARQIAESTDNVK